MVRRLTRYLVKARSDNQSPSFFLIPLILPFIRWPLSFTLIILWLRVIPLNNVLAFEPTTSAPSLILLIKFLFTLVRVSALFWFRSRWSRRVWRSPLILVFAMRHMVSAPLLILLLPFPFTPGRDYTLFFRSRWSRWSRRFWRSPLILVFAIRHTVSAPLLMLLLLFPFTPSRDATPSNVSLFHFTH